MLQPGAQIGPFVIERDIGAGAMGAVYRGLYPKTGQKVAIKIMLPGAAENKSTAERFRREIEILKQFAHPNIVRIVGDGKHQGQRFYAMEYIQGESLDRVLSRRGRISWEEVVQYGQQLCAALQHAHSKGVVHRDLKPSNLMLLPDGTLKLTDFGIAKDLDVTQLTEANCTVGTASYMSPEQCKGERDLSQKSDLYSLGVVFYELLTGRKPFVAENVMDMFMLHVKGVPERPSRLVDVPKWLDILIMQLLEKKPDQRPRDAAMVGQALADVLEKVEAGHSAGVEAIKSRKPGEDRDENDREAALALSGKKKKKGKKKPTLLWYQRAWVKVVALLVPLLGIAVALWLVFRPPSADKLYERIEKRMVKAGNDPAQLENVKPALLEYLRLHGKNDDERTRQVRAWNDWVGLTLAEVSLRKTAETVKKDVIKIEKMDALEPAERLAVEAVLAEDKGNLDEATKKWEELKQQYGSNGGVWLLVAERRLNGQYPEVAALLKELDAELKKLARLGKEPELTDEAKKRAFLAFRAENLGDTFEARSRWNALKADMEKRPEQRTWFLLAASRAAKQGSPSGDNRDELLKKRLKEAEVKFDNGKGDFSGPETTCLTLIALYADNPDGNISDVVKDARKLYDSIQQARGGNR